MSRFRTCSLAFLVLLGAWPVATSANWPQFRGPAGNGLAAGKDRLPVQFGPGKNVLWKVPLPPGLSSPCIWGDRIFLTGRDPKGKKLETLCLDRRTGRTLWRKTAPADKLEKVHHTSSTAASTPATDGERVYVYFGSYGLLCYDFAGKELWKVPLPVPSTTYGSATSPVVAEGLLLIKRQGNDSSFLALNPRTGAIVWKKEKLPFDAGYALPLIVPHKDGSEVVIQGDRGIRAYALKDGKERWSRTGLFCAAIPTPIAAEGLLFFVVQYPGGDRDEPLKLPTFDDLLKKYDKNKNGKLERDEVKDVVLYSRDGVTSAGDIKLTSLFGFLDRNRDGSIDRFEWGLARLSLSFLRNSLLAVRPGARGALDNKHIAWQDSNSLPEIASPLCYQGRLYLVKHTPRGGIVSCLQAKTGKLLYRQRLGAAGLFYASPVAGDGKIYVPSLRGTVVVLEAGDKFKVLARNDLGEAIGATPALVDGVIYVRTDKHLYAFKE
jgi:outer membrane protein assembly factor BamB